MTIQFNASSDLGDVIDGLEAVTLRRRESGAIVSVSTALCRQRTAVEAEPSGGWAQKADADWYLQLPTGEVAPEVGDVVIDATGNHWTVLNIEQQSLLDRWKCMTRELRVSMGCDDLVDVQRAEWDDLGEGLVIVGWDDVYTALPVRIQHDQTELSDTSNAPVATERFTIILGDDFPLTANDRFVASDGAIYRLESIEQADRIDKLPIAKVVRVSP